ncbi:MAG: RNase P subunit p30 family protein [Candidatus Helarchaeota archaeon]
MKKYYDLNVEINFQSKFEEILEHLLFLHELGYTGIGVVFPYDKIKEFRKLKTICEENGFIIYSRINIKGKSTLGLKKALKNVRQNYELIGVECFNIEIAHWAIQDSRPDILILNQFGLLNYNYKTAKLINNNEKALEISLKPLIFTNFRKRSKILRFLSKRIRFFIKAKADFILTMNSTGSSIYDTRAPRDLMSLLYLMNIPENIANKTMSEFPEHVIQRALNKRDQNIISKNIRIITNEEDDIL